MGLIDTAYVKQYSDSVMHLAQQKFSQLRGAVRVEPLVGEEGYFEQLGTLALIKKTSRHADTPILNPDHQRRRVTSDPFGGGVYRDTVDKARILIEPNGPYAQAQAMAAGRLMDQTIIDQFDAVAKGGKDGTTSFTFTAANTVAVDFGGTDTNLDMLKLREVKRILTAANVLDSELHCAVSASQIYSLLGVTQVTSSDYAAVKALVDGEVNRFMGFTFHVFGEDSTTGAMLPKVGDDRSTYYWAKEGMLLAVADELDTTVDRMPGKSNSILTQSNIDIGATRMEETKVVEVLCDETVLT